MAVSISRNLKLRIDSNLTANAKYNLERIDLLGSVLQTDSTNQVNIRSQEDVVIEPQSPDVGGSGVGGSVSVGNANHILDSVALWAASITVPVSIGLKDQATSGTKYLRMKYKTDLNGSLDTSADRTLSVDMEGADRSLILGGSLGVLGGDLTLNLTGLTSVTLPQTGTLSTLSGVETLTNKTISGLDNTLSNIAYSSLVLTGTIVNADVSSSAAIAYSKLNLGNSLVNSDISASAAIAYSKLNLTSSLVDADISNSAAISYSKLNLNNSVTLADLISTISIPYSKLDLTASVESSDLAPGVLAGLLPDQSGNSGKFLRTDGSSLSWETVGGVSGVATFTDTWSSGTTKVVSHGLSTTNVVVFIIDNTENVVYADVVVTDANTVTITSSEAPTGTWRVVVHG